MEDDLAWHQEKPRSDTEQLVDFFSRRDTIRHYISPKHFIAALRDIKAGET
jgi:hypothetical protein